MSICQVRAIPASAAGGPLRSCLPSLALALALVSRREFASMFVPVTKLFRDFQPRLTSLCSSSNASIKSHPQSPPTSSTPKSSDNGNPRQPRSLQALHLKPLKREAEYGIPSCDLQLRSFSVQPLEFFSDFALRAAYYLGLPAYGPVPLPRITERWTVPKSHFIFKKAQENFERVTLRRMIQIKDGNPETVQLWLAYLRKHQFYGVGMKANVWEFSQSCLNSSNNTRESQLGQLDDTWSHLGQVRGLGTPDKVEEILNSRRFKDAAGLRQPLATNK